MDIKDKFINVIIKYKRIKHVYFRIDDKNNLVVSAPVTMKELEVKSIIKKKEDEIYEMYVNVSKKNESDKEFNYLGKIYDVKYVDSLDKVGFKNSFVYAKNEDMLTKFWVNECIKVFNGEANICKKCFNNLPEFKIKVRKMRTRWGVCNTRTDEITLNTELLKKRLDIIDYVIIHEMCHFYEPNHSKDFWALVEGACPNYKALRKELKKWN